MPAPICILCRKEMNCEKNGLVVHDPEVGDFPATYWIGDMYKCSSCGSEIAIGFSRGLSKTDIPNGDLAVAIEFTYK